MALREPIEVWGLPPSDSDQDDRALTLAFQRGEKGSYQAIHDRHRERVHSVCRRMLGNPHDAEEAAQETFLRVYQALGRFNGRYQMKAWVTRIATNVCLDHLRARSRKPAQLEPVDVIELVETDNDFESDPQELHLRDLEGRRVRKVLASLPPMHRAAIVLRDFEGLSYAEVAVALQITECQVKALIHRARQRFKRTWMQPLAALVPWRLADRIKGMGAGRERAAEAVTQVGQSAAACSGLLQQCSAYVSQHVATAVTAAVVGTAAGAASHAAMADRSEAPVKERARIASEAPATGKLAASVRPQRQPKRADSAADSSTHPPSSGEVNEVTEPEASPSTSPSSEATPSPTDSSSPPPPADPSPEPIAPSQPVVRPFLPRMGFDWGDGVRAREPELNDLRVSCAGSSFEQRLNTVVDDDDSPVTYPAAFILQSGTGGVAAGSLSLELWVTKNGHRIYYTGSAALLDGSFDGDIWKIAFDGTYATTDSAAAQMDLPGSGGFTAALELDCRRLSVVTESVVLGT